MNGYFVTGTDPGVGKTTVTAALARRARERGQRVFGFKPVETGCEPQGSHLVGADQMLVCAAAGDWQTDDLRGVYQFRRPVAPLVAAEEGRPIDLGLIERTARAGASQSDLTLVEGAGGWRVPLTETDDMSALPRRLDLPVIVVARAVLGTINHSLLTVQAVESDGCRVAALILSRRPDEDPAFAESNADQIRRRWPGRVIIFDGAGATLDPLLA